mgnify:CR=1 FL=1
MEVFAVTNFDICNESCDHIAVFSTHEKAVRAAESLGLDEENVESFEVDALDSLVGKKFYLFQGRQDANDQRHLGARQHVLVRPYVDIIVSIYGEYKERDWIYVYSAISEGHAKEVYEEVLADIRSKGYSDLVMNQRYVDGKREICRVDKDDIIWGEWVE